jgi:large subunit ribosomal protein L24
MLKLKKGDTVKITSGKDKGKTGKIETVFAKKDKVLVPGVNIYKKHIKPQFTVDGKGGIYEFPRAMDVAKVTLICPNCEKATRVGFKVEGNKKIRVCKKCGKAIDGGKTK